MADQNPVDQVQTIIGPWQKGNYELDPQKHAALFASSAPALAEVLKSPELEAIIERYDESDRRAKAAGKKFRSVGTWANLAVFLTVLLGAALLAAVQLPPEYRKTALIALTIAAALSAALATMWLFQIRAAKLLERWMTARADAETLRLDYFLYLTNAAADPADASSPIRLPLLQLEYFRCYQLELQMEYFKTRGAEHQKAADRTVRMSMGAVLLASLGSGLGGGFLAAAMGPGWAALAILGPIAAGLTAFATAQEALSQDSRNAERYDRAFKALSLLKGQIGPVRKFAAAGELPPVQTFVQAIHEQLSLEHKQWLGETESTKEALEALGKSLKEAQERIEKQEKPKGAGA